MLGIILVVKAKSEIKVLDVNNFNVIKGVLLHFIIYVIMSIIIRMLSLMRITFNPLGYNA